MSGGASRRPPRVGAALIRLSLPPGSVRETVLGDLAEEYHLLSRSRSPGSAAGWYLRQAAAVAGHSLADRLAGRPWFRPDRGGAFSPIPSGTRGFRPGLILHQIAQDLTFALRQFTRRPGFTLVAVLSLSLGIGANTAIFSLANSVLIQPLNVSEPHQLTSVFTSRTEGEHHGETSYPDYLDYRDRNQVFSGLAAHALAPMAIAGNGQPRVGWGQLVSWDYFEVLGVEPELGRAFLPEEDETLGTHPVAVLSHGTWQGQFGSDPKILGKTVRINGYPFTIAGVAPAGFRGLMPFLEPVLWAPLAMAEQALPFSPNIESRIDPWLRIVARLEAGFSASDAQVAMDILAADLATEFPETNRNKGIAVASLDANRLGAPEVTDGARKLMAVLLGVVGFVLLIACFNVANLELSKAAGRRKEIGLRHSLGASRWRIVRQLLVESILLALIAGVVGMAVAVVSIDALLALQTQAEVPIQIQVGLDHRVLGFTLMLALSTGVLFGLAPALHVLRTGPSGALRGQGQGLRNSTAGGRLQASLVAAQVALSFALLTGSGLLIRSLNNTLAIDPGFGLRSGIVMPLNLGYGQYAEADGRALHQNLLDHVASWPGVESATLSAFVPLGMAHGHHDVHVEGYEPTPDETMLVKRNMVSAGYFETMDIRILRGRAIDEGDTEDAALVAMVNETMARRFWPGEDPIGGAVQADLGNSYTVVGVIENGKYGSLREPPEPYLVLPLSQSEYVECVNLVLKTGPDPGAMIQPLSAEVQMLVPDLPQSTVLTVPQYLEYAQGGARAPAILVSVFGALALFLASVGMYGVMFHNVTLRTREFGVRLAVGATQAGVVGMVLIQGLKTTLLGLCVGLVLALAMARALSGLLYNVPSMDLAVFAVGAAALLTVGQVASYLPARFASKAHPVTILQAE